MEGSGVVKNTSDYTSVAIWIIMLTAKSEIQPSLNKLWADFNKIFRIALSYKEQLIKSFRVFWTTLQIGNVGNMGIMSCLGQGGLCSLSVFVLCIGYGGDTYTQVLSITGAHPFIGTKANPLRRDNPASYMTMHRHMHRLMWLCVGEWPNAYFHRTQNTPTIMSTMCTHLPVDEGHGEEREDEAVTEARHRRQQEHDVRPRHFIHCHILQHGPMPPPLRVSGPILEKTSANGSILGGSCRLGGYLKNSEQSWGAQWYLKSSQAVLPNVRKKVCFSS